MTPSIPANAQATVPPEYAVSVFDQESRIEEVLRRLDKSATVDQLVAVLRGTGVPRVRLRICELLGVRLIKTAVPPLTERLEDTDLRVRAAAADGLSEIFSRSAMPPRHRAADVVAVLGRRWEVEESSAVRSRLVRTFALVGDPSVRPILQEATTHPHETVRAQARWALGHVDRRAYG